MSSGYPGGSDFYNSAGIGRGSATINNGQVRYRSQLGGVFRDGSSPMTLPRRTDMVAKRPFSELELQHHLQQQQQQQQQPLGGGSFLRSVKQSYHHASPISPLSPVDFSPPDVSGSIAPAVPFTLSGRYGLPLTQQLRPQSINPNNNHNQHHQGNILSCNPPLPGSSFTNCLLLKNNNNQAVALDSEPESEKKMRNRLQESSPSSASCSSKQSFIDVAAAISGGKMDATAATISWLKQVSNARGNPEQRLTTYMVSAFQSRVNPSENPPQVAELGSNEHVMATQMLYDSSPCFKLGFMAANLAILEATRDQPNNVHVVDLDIGQGNQYTTLIHALGERQSGKPTILKITTVIKPGSNHNEDGLRVADRLKKLADQVGVNLKFNAVNRRIAEQGRDALGCHADEALAVNFTFKLYRMPDESVSTENPQDHCVPNLFGINFGSSLPNSHFTPKNNGNTKRYSQSGARLSE